MLITFIPDTREALFGKMVIILNYPNGQYSTDVYTDKMISFIKKRS